MEQQLEIMWDSQGLAAAVVSTPPTIAQPLPPEVPDQDVTPSQPGDLVSQPAEVLEQPLPPASLSVAHLLAMTPPLPSAPNETEPLSEQQRIQQLEQALYQCQLYIDELKKKLIDQEFLEEQLAATEAFSHVQKQAIETLKSQVEQQQKLEGEITRLNEHVHVLEVQAAEAEALAQHRETLLATFKIQAQQDRAELDRLRDKNAQLTAHLESMQSSMVQETQHRIIAQKTAERLRLELRNHESSVRSLESKLQRADAALADREAMITALQDLNRPDSQKDQFIQGLSNTLLKAQRQITELENELSSQSILQAQLQHTTHELEQGAKSSQVRSEELEHQVNDLQEQVLRQAQQASEYETAIQHWKTRCLEAEEWTAQLSKLWDTLQPTQIETDISPTLATTLTDLARWFKGSQGGNLALNDTPPLSPRELLGMRTGRPNL